MGVTKDEAFWIVEEAQSYITLKQWADDAEYARRAYERLIQRHWVYRDFKRVDNGPACTGWEREALERQVLNYVLDNGYFPSKDTVKTLKANAAAAKKQRASAAQIRQAQTVLGKEAA